MIRHAIALLATIAAPALAADQATLDTRRILAGTVTTQSVKNAYLTGARDSTSVFKGALGEVKKLYFKTCHDGTVMRQSAPCPVPTQPVPIPILCSDGTQVPAGSTCPPPPPPPPPVKCPDGTTVPAGSTCELPPPPPPPPTTVPLTGETAIADNFSLTGWLEPGETYSIGGSPGAFRFTCLAGQVSRDDPIVYPGQPGKSHVHQFFGNTATDASSTYQSLRATGGSTCTRSEGTSPQRSAYWMPAMLDGAGNVVKPDWMNTYYKQLPASDPLCARTVVSLTNLGEGPAIGKCIPIPNGIRFIFGYNMATGTGGPADPGSRDSEAMGFDCVSKASVGGASYTGLKRTLEAIVADGRCPEGEWLRVYLAFPQCWDGKNIDTPDHRAHIVFPPQSICPQTHPYKIPEIAISAFFTTDANFKAGKWRLASDEMMPGTVPGSTLHMDYWEAWSPPIKDLWQKNCIDGPMSCSNGNLGDGRKIRGMGQIGPFPNHVTVPVSSIP